jgi:hypothetical protein
MQQLHLQSLWIYNGSYLLLILILIFLLRRQISGMGCCTIDPVCAQVTFNLPVPTTLTQPWRSIAVTLSVKIFRNIT